MGKGIYSPPLPVGRALTKVACLIFTGVLAEELITLNIAVKSRHCHVLELFRQAC